MKNETTKTREEWAAILGTALRALIVRNIGSTLTDRQKRLFDKADWVEIFASEVPDTTALLPFRYGLSPAQLGGWVEANDELWALVKAGQFDELLKLSASNPGPLWSEPVSPEVEAVDAMFTAVEGAWWTASP